MSAEIPLAPADRRLLELLARGDAVLERDDVLRITTDDGLVRRRIDPARLVALAAEGLVLRTGTDVSLAATGRARLAREAVAADVDGFRLQHGAVEAVLASEGPPRLVERAESPLAWLARRRGRDGRPLLSPARHAAGERLRADFTLARMMPTVTSNWSSGRIAAGRGGSGGLADLTDRALAARDRVETALAAVGADLSGVVLDVCCFLKGLETVESERRWPARSAKVVIDIALGLLAAHYGIAEEARGRDRARGIRRWGTPDFRPTRRRGG